jgi:hypothetical protein
MSSPFSLIRGLVSGALLASAFASVAHAAITPPAPHCPGTVNAILGDESFRWATGRLPDANDGEDLRIRTHLTHVEALLRARNVSDWPAAAREARERNLDRLHEYRMAGSFPRHERCPVGRKPVFIDHEGRICAVGYLVEQSAGRELAAAIDARFHEARIAEMESRALADWTMASGLTALELAMIQPCYGCPEYYDCLKMSGRVWMSSPFPGGTLNAVAIIDRATSLMLDGSKLSGEFTMQLGPATFDRVRTGPVYDNYMYERCRFTIFNDKGTTAVYTPSPPNLLTPPTFEDGEVFLTGSCQIMIWHDHQFSSYSLLAGVLIDGGSHRTDLVTPYADFYGWDMHLTADDGYQFQMSSATLSATCNQLPEIVEPTSWGRIKATYR